MKFDTRGVLLADVPNAGISRRDTNAASGNPLHDARSGKFGAGSRKAQKAPPPNTDPTEYARMLDAVRDAAREFDDPGEGDIRDFIKGRATNPDQVDIAAFFQMVQDQRKSDIIDLIDQQLRSGGSMASGKRKVRISAPKGYLRKAMGNMEAADLAEVMHRLEARGHSPEQLDDYFNKRAKNHEGAKQQKAAVAAADDALGFAPEGYLEMHDYDDDSDSEDLVLFAERLIKNLPQPIVNVTPEVNVTIPVTKKIPVRDERGFITEVREEVVE